MIVFVVSGPPVPKERPRLARNGRTYTPLRTLRYERSVRDAARAAMVGLVRWSTGQRYSVAIEVRVSDARRRDLDNVAKSVLDGLNGLAWIDDCQVDALSIWRERSLKGQDGITVRVAYMGEDQ